MLRRFCPLVASALLFSALTAGPAQAQTAAQATTARDLIKALMIPHLKPGETTDDFEKRREDLTNAIGNAIAIGVATASVGGASAGFAVLVDKTTGTSSLKSDSFGPLFLDRPLTSGRRAVNLSFTFNHTSFDRFQGTDLRNTGLLFFDNRVFFKTSNYEQFQKEYGTLEPDVSIFTVHGSYGLTDRVDIGVIVPFASVNLRGRRYWDYDASVQYPFDPVTRAAYPNGPKGTNFTQDEGEVSASGIGDITIRGTVALGAQRGEGAAVIGALRLPTGSEEDLLGTGKASGLLKFVGSKVVSERASVYGNGGYAFGGLSDEVTYGAGVDCVLLPRKNLTVSLRVPRPEPSRHRQRVHERPDRPFGTIRHDNVPTDHLFGKPLVLLAWLGQHDARRVWCEVLLGGGAIVSGAVLFPISDTGLRASTTAFVGLEISVRKR